MPEPIITDAVEILHRRHFAGNPEALAELDAARAAAREEARIYAEAESWLPRLPPHAFRLGTPERDDAAAVGSWIVPLFKTDETPRGIYWPGANGDVGMLYLDDDGERWYEFAHEAGWHCLRGAEEEGSTDA